MLIGAITVYAAGYRVVVRRGAPLLAPKLLVPSRRDIDWRLIVGAPVFGAGWGLGGYCPGPALAALGSPTAASLTFAVAMVVGMAVFTLLDSRLAQFERARMQPRPSGAPARKSGDAASAPVQQ